MYNEVFIVHCRILENYAISSAGLNIIYTELDDDYQFTIFLNKTNISGNRADGRGVAIVVYIMSDNNFIHNSVMSNIDNSDMIVVLIIDSMYIYNNTVVHLQHEGAVIWVLNVNQCWINGTKIINNTGSSIAARNSNIFLQGHVEFSGNTAYAGAAILLDCPNSDLPSFLTLLPNTTVTITNNTALYYGGGIAVSPVCNYGDYCFIQLPYMTGNNTSEELNTVVYFEGNVAHTAGNSIYGPPLSHCKMMDGWLGEEDVFLTLFSIEELLF